MERIVGKRKKIGLSGFNIQKKSGTLLLFNGNEQIGPFGEDIDATKICKRIVISKECLKKR